MWQVFSDCITFDQKENGIKIKKHENYVSDIRTLSTQVSLKRGPVLCSSLPSWMAQQTVLFLQAVFDLPGKKVTCFVQVT